MNGESYPIGCVDDAAAGTAPAARASRRGRSRALACLASPRLTLAGFGALAASLVAVNIADLAATWLIGAPCLLLSANLSAAITVNPAFRRRPALLVFHLALAAVLLLAAVGRLTYMKGELELSTGDVFEGVLTRTEQGPLHTSRLERVRFRNDGFSIGYEPGVKRSRTSNRITLLDDRGPRPIAIGDTVPLVASGYRFYTSFNKGFAPVFQWRPAGNEALRGSVHLPSYPLHEYRQAQAWTPPGTDRKLWIMLQFDEVLLDPGAPSQFRLPGTHTLVLRDDTRRYELAPGARVELAEGVLIYEGLTTWMGYTVFSDWTLPWLFASAVLAALSLAWHFLTSFAARPPGAPA